MVCLLCIKLFSVYLLLDILTFLKIGSCGNLRSFSVYYEEREIVTFNNPIISVIIPTYNRVNKICASIDSVVNQTYQNWELIIIDDGSNDNTGDVIRERYLCDKRIKYIKLCNNSGCSVARNEGLRVAVGEYVAFLDSDDEWESEHLLKAINIFNNQNVGIYLSFWYTECGGKKEKICKSEEDFIYLNEVITELNPKVVDNGYLFDKGLFEYASIEWFYFFHINTLVVSRKILEQSGVFDETLSTCEDTDFILRLLSFGNVFFSQSYDFIYQQSKDGIYSFLSYIGDYARRNRLQSKEINKLSIIELNKIRARFNSLAYYNQHNAKMSFEDFEQEIYNYIYKKYAYISYLYSLNDINLSRYYLNLAIKYCRDIKDIDYLKSMRDKPYLLDLANVNKW